MSYQRDRDEFLTIAANEGIPLDVARSLMRAASTLNRLAEASCNGDWPCDNGERRVKPCAKCQSLYAPSVLLKGGLCPDCRTEDRVRKLLAPLNIEPVFNGDPRGAVLKLRLPSGRTNDWGHEGICVPTRG